VFVAFTPQQAKVPWLLSKGLNASWLGINSSDIEWKCLSTQAVAHPLLLLDIVTMSAGKLYTTIASGNAYKIRLLHSLLGLDLEHIEIDFAVCD
jgi:hypothetical protein